MNAKIISALVAGGVLVALQGAAQDSVEVVRGDFDGDGKIDKVWIEATYDEEGYALTPLVLRSNNPNIDRKLQWEGGMGVALSNLGDLNDTDRDFLGASPYAMSTWCSFETYGFRNGQWKKVIASFDVWYGNDNYSNRVIRSDRPGYVTIVYNIMDGENFEDQYKDVKLNW